MFSLLQNETPFSFMIMEYFSVSVIGSPLLIINYKDCTITRSGLYITLMLVSQRGDG